MFGGQTSGQNFKISIAGLKDEQRFTFCKLPAPPA